MVGLYLVPASSENMKKTIANDVDISIAEKFLSVWEYNRLKDLLGSEKRFHCSAMTEASRSRFEKMGKGDIALFVEKGTGLFRYQAEVLFTAASEEMGNYLWSYVPYKPWNLIYFVKNVQEINIDKKALVMALGYKSSYEVPGVIRIKDEYLHNAIEKYGSIQTFLDTLPKKEYKEILEEAGKLLVNNDLKDKVNFPKEDYERPDTLVKLIQEIELLKNDSEHKERAHESLVESFYDLLGFNKHTEIKYRQGRVDIGISLQNKAIIANEVKKDWHLSWKDRNVVKQGYGYAFENGARFVVITNGDYYAIFDRNKGLDIDSNLIGEFRLTRLNKGCLLIIEMLKKDNLIKKI